MAIRRRISGGFVCGTECRALAARVNSVVKRADIDGMIE